MTGEIDLTDGRVSEIYSLSTMGHFTVVDLIQSANFLITMQGLAI